MDFFQIECFTSIAHHMSFTEASFEMCISQSSLSKYISRMEDELEVKLFNRDRRNISLTPAGQEFLLFAEEELEQWKKIQRRMKKYSEYGCVQVGSIENIGKVGLTGPIAEFLEKHPQIEVQITMGDTLSLMDSMEKGLYDLAFIAQISTSDHSHSNLDSYHLDKYDFYTIVEDEYHVIVPKNHPLAGNEVITWEDLRHEKFIILDKTYSSNQIIRGSFSSNGIDPDIIYECKQVDTILGLVTAGLGLSILSGRMAWGNEHLTTVKLDQPICRNTVVVVPKSERCPKAVQVFLKHILKCYKLELP